MKAIKFMQAQASCSYVRLKSFKILFMLTSCVLLCFAENANLFTQA